jgi:hypothetical protein
VPASFSGIHQVPVAFVGIELQGETADVAFRVGRPALAGNARASGKHLGLLAHLREDLRLREAGDVV